jgi:raffinose/stachyose/melibiose transport system permease protein
VNRWKWPLSILALLATLAVFVAPFAFILLTASMDRVQASQLQLALPKNPQVWQNLVEVFRTRDYQLVTAFLNSAILTVVSVSAMTLLSAMVAFLIQRRPDGFSRVANFLVMAGLIIPPAIVPTIWVLQRIGLFKSMPGMILIEVAYGLAFCTMIFRAFISTIPRELDEAAIVDGAGPIRLFFTIVFPLLKPTIVTAVVTQSVAVFNDFVNPLYYLPSNPTVQLTLYNFQSQYTSQYNLLFMDILLITIPPLIVFVLFSRQMVAGMMSGAVKG